jgi:hypothetical protein
MLATTLTSQASTGSIPVEKEAEKKEPTKTRRANDVRCKA